MNNNSWIAEFAKCLELGTTKASLANSYDEIVVWMRSSTDPDSVYSELESRYSKEWLALRYEEFLDRLFVSESALAPMFPASLPSEQAKKRYRQLIRVFHPDRGAHEEMWLNYRAERVNKAFNEYERQPARPIADIMSAVEAPLTYKGRVVSKPKQGAKIKYRPNLLRQKLGNARQVQRKIILSLVVCSSIMILIVFASSRDVVRSAPGKLALVNDDSANQRLGDQALPIKRDDDIGVDEQQSGIILNPTAQRILDQAEWLNEVPPELVIAENDFIDQPENEIDDVNFSSFDTQRRPVSQLVTPKVIAIDGGDGRNRTDRVFVTSDRVSASTPSAPQLEAVSLPVKVQNRMDEERSTICDGVVNNAISITSQLVAPSVAALNVRSGPSIKCRIAWTMVQGQRATQTRSMTSGDFVWINLSWFSAEGQKRSGWASDRYLTPVVEQVITKPEPKRPALISKKIEVVSPVIQPSIAVAAPVTVVAAIDKVAVNQLKSAEASLKAKLRAVVDKLDRAYEIGDSASLASIYLNSGRENSLKGSKYIQRKYNRLFKNTKAREVTYNIGRHWVGQDGQVYLTGNMVTSFTGRLITVTARTVATFKFVMVMQGGEYKIASFDSKKI
ncbi:MAG: hypothetical protein ACI9OI_002066 [Chitinophagales bacterium]|jgi:hypothetical protein